jgi:5-formyltetrahydrofolate cyclo-ligase
MLVPALAFDVKGYRLGYGGGYYDRYLPYFHGITFGIAFYEDVFPELPHEPHDMRVSYIVTDEIMI